MAGATVAPRSACAVVLLDDSFTDGDRTNQSLTSSAAWFYLRNNATSGGSNPPSLTASADNEGQLIYSLGASTGSTANIVGHFTATDSPYVLQVGETLVLTIDVSLDAIPADGAAFGNTPIRFGLFNSGGSRVTADNTADFQSSAFFGDRGYSAWFNPDGSTTAIHQVRERVGSSNAIFSSGAGVNNLLGDNDATAIGMAATTATTLQLSISRTSETDATVVSSLNGVTISRVDTASAFFDFDMVAIQFGSSVTGAKFDRIAVEVVVPEPASVGWIGLGAAMVVLRCHRK